MLIKIINESSNPLPAYETSGSAGMDIRAFLKEETPLKPMERKLIPTGLFIELPDGYEAQIRPRSGMAFKHGITLPNAPATIDSDYRGELQVPIINLSQETFIIRNGDRIAQMVIAKYEKINWEETTDLTQTKRGEGGFGSTGINA
jgi:dUTP pyrophosphatase